LSHYDECLKELKEKGEKLANQYVLELYTILRDEEKLPREDCRARIEHDCLDLWSKATIRKYLPPEAKDFKKRAAGKVGSENKKNKKALLLVAQSDNGARTNLAEDVSVIQKEEESRSFHKELDQKLSSRTISPDLLEANKIIADKDSIIERLTKENEELVKQHNPTSSHGKSVDIHHQQQQLELESQLSKKDALIKELNLRINHLEANDERTESKFPFTSNDQDDNPTVDFELSFPFEEVQNHMNSIYNEAKGLVNIISFHGRLNLKTRKVVAVSISKGQV
jgi:hypothetical protein